MSGHRWVAGLGEEVFRLLICFMKDAGRISVGVCDKEM